jgi:hypothetical protein
MPVHSFRADASEGHQGDHRVVWHGLVKVQPTKEGDCAELSEYSVSSGDGRLIEFGITTVLQALVSVKKIIYYDCTRRIDMYTLDAQGDGRHGHCHEYSQYHYDLPNFGHHTQECHSSAGMAWEEE